MLSSRISEYQDNIFDFRKLSTDEISKTVITTEISISIKDSTNYCPILNELQLFNDTFMLKKIELDDDIYWCITKNISPILVPSMKTSFEILDNNANYLIKSWNFEEKKFMLDNSLIFNNLSSLSDYIKNTRKYPAEFKNKIYSYIQKNNSSYINNIIGDYMDII